MYLIFLNDYLWLNKREVHSSFSMKRKKQRNCFKSNGMFICLCFSSPNMKQSQEKKKEETVYTVLCHVASEYSTLWKWTNGITVHTHAPTHTHTHRQAGGTHVYILSINVNILSLVWNDVYILFQTLDIVYALEWL